MVQDAADFSYFEIDGILEPFFDQIQYYCRLSIFILFNHHMIVARLAAACNNDFDWFWVWAS
jgi:hypothetical protein